MLPALGDKTLVLFNDYYLLVVCCVKTSFQFETPTCLNVGLSYVCLVWLFGVGQ